MTNEQYLVVSYFCAAAGGVIMAVILIAFLRKDLRRAVGSVVSPLGRLLGRVFPAWLVLTVLFAFMLVSYFDCSHHTYQEVVKDYPHMASVTRSQVQHMLIFTSIALFAFVLFLAVVLGVSRFFAGGRRERRPE